MKNKKILSLFLAAASTVTMLAGCGSKPTSDAESPVSTATVTTQPTSGHEPITIQSPYNSISTFVSYVHEKYPEINLEVQVYSGTNTSSYWKAQLQSGEMPDIYFTSTYPTDITDKGDKLIDLSGYDFTGNFLETQLHNVTENGSVYLLPLYYACFGIGYNKDILQENGWELPQSLAELRELAPKVEEAGYQLALDNIALPGFGFQYLCNILDTTYLNTLEGRRWQSAYLTGEANASDNAELMSALSVLDEWRDLGMLNGNGDTADDAGTVRKVAEGNTLFWLCSKLELPDGSTPENFGWMPYLSEDGSGNTFILNVNRYVGLNKHLQDPGNEQKLQDALHVMELLSTVEGLTALNSDSAEKLLMPLKEFSVSDDSPYKEIEDDLNNGNTAPMLYSGWDNVVVPVGNEMLAYIQGGATIEDIAKCLDGNQHLITAPDSETYAIPTETLTTDDCARMLGIAYAEATGADLALISKNQWFDIPDGERLNADGVSGELYPLPITDLKLATILPSGGWTSTIETVTLTGARIKELAETGYNYQNAGNLYPYELVTPEGFTLADDKTYTVAICGVEDEDAANGSLTDTGVTSMDALRTYLNQFETLSKADLVWEK